MEGRRGKSTLLGWTIVAALMTPIASANAAVTAGPVGKAAEAAAFKAVFSTDCPGADLAPDRTTRTEARIATLSLLNQVRQAAGLQPLENAQPLRHIAAEHSRDMVIRGYFSHTGPVDKTLASRLRTIDWRGCAGENIGYGTMYLATPRSMMWAWMRSTGHRENIHEPSFRWIGIAISLGTPTGATQYAATYTTDFGGPA
jgi:uncharacterized protein YkwD